MRTETNQAARLTVAILAGGLGSRLRPVLSDRPKVLAPVGGRPFLAWWFDRLAAQGFREVVLCTAHLADQVKETFGPAYRNLRLRYSVENQPLGTGEALRHALPLFHSDSVLVFNGDSFCDVDLSRFIRDHFESGLRASLVLTRVEDGSRFGSVKLQADGRVEEFREKTGPPAAGWINAGIYLLSRDLLAASPAKQSRSLERDLLPRWVPEGINAFRHRGKFIDIGTPDSLAQAEDFFLGLNLAVA
jgi:NDP-sugar pyrophosphorylase family protein